jgi:hypothetical protein
MAEGTVLQTPLGTTVAISATLPASYNAAGYAASTITYSTIGKVEDLGEHGGEAGVSQFTSVDDGVTEKFKGAFDYGAMEIVLGCLPSDAGQDIVEAAFASRNRYSVKVSYPARTGEATPEIHYLDVLVTRRLWRDGAVDNVRRLSTRFEICRAPVVVAAT